MGIIITKDDSLNYDYDLERDVRTVINYEAIASSPSRMARVNKVIRDSANFSKRMSKGGYDNTPSRHNNPATIKKM